MKKTIEEIIKQSDLFKEKEMTELKDIAIDRALEPLCAKGLQKETIRQEEIKLFEKQIEREHSLLAKQETQEKFQAQEIQQKQIELGKSRGFGISM